MNLIDFHVTEIISETYDKVYKLYHMSDAEFADAKGQDKSPWIKHLGHDGCKQVYRYWDDGGESVGEHIFDITRGEKPYKVGYVGQH